MLTPLQKRKDPAARTEQTSASSGDGMDTLCKTDTKKFEQEERLVSPWLLVFNYRTMAIRPTRYDGWADV